MKLSIIIPCYNEKRTIVNILDRVESDTKIDKEIIIVDDKSSDGSDELINSYKFKSPNKRTQ